MERAAAEAAAKEQQRLAMEAQAKEQARLALLADEQARVAAEAARKLAAARLGLPAPALPPIPTQLLGRHGSWVGM